MMGLDRRGVVSRAGKLLCGKPVSIVCYETDGDWPGIGGEHPPARATDEERNHVECPKWHASSRFGSMLIATGFACSWVIYLRVFRCGQDVQSTRLLKKRHPMSDRRVGRGDDRCRTRGCRTSSRRQSGKNVQSN